MNVHVHMCARRYVPTHGVTEHEFSQISGNLWITKVPSNFLLTDCSHAILCSSEGVRSQIFTAAHRLLFPVYTNLWNTLHVTENHGAPPHIPGSPNKLQASEGLPGVCPRVWMQSPGSPSHVSSGFMTKWRSTCLFGSWAVICLFLWSSVFSLFFFLPA